MRHHDYDDEPYIVIEKHSGGVGSLPPRRRRSAPAWRCCSRRARARDARATSAAVRARAQDRGARTSPSDVTDQVVDTFEKARGRVEEQIDTARSAIDHKKRQVSRAMEAGREAAQQAREELERRIAETKAAYNAGADVARSGRAGPGQRAGRRGRRHEPRGRGASAARFEPPRLTSPVALHSASAGRCATTRSASGTTPAKTTSCSSPAGIAFNILLAAVPFVLLLVWGFATFLLNKSVRRGEPASSSTTSTACFRRTRRRVRTRRSTSCSTTSSARTRSSAIWSAVGFVWFSTRLFGSLRTVLASVFDIENERGIIQGKIFDIKITILVDAADHGERADQHLRAPRDQDAAVQVLEDLGIRKDVMGRRMRVGHASRRQSLLLA